MAEVDDLTCRELARILKRLDGSYPVSDRYIHEVRGFTVRAARTDRRHADSVLHEERSAVDVSCRRPVGDASARACYNRLRNAASLLWIAETVGVDAETVERAYDAAVEADDHRRACGAIRKIIPWEKVYPLASRLL